MQETGWKLVIHGGAGTIAKSRSNATRDAAVRAALDEALAAGESVLANGGEALDAVEAAVKSLEDDANFNAGRGSVLTYDGAIEMDASIMDGRNRSAGAVAEVSATRNPICLARAVMEKSGHVMLSGNGADEFSNEQGLEQAPPSWFVTAERRKQLERLKSNDLNALDVEYKYGTVGAVALDGLGHLAAATSTGGMTGKRWGRIGDSPIIGAGTYADDRSVAVSATGSGEYFIRAAAAHQLAERVRLCGDSLRDALDSTLADIGDLGGTGGLIAVSAKGEMEWGFSTAGMYRGRADSSGRTVALYSDSEER